MTKESANQVTNLKMIIIHSGFERESSSDNNSFSILMVMYHADKFRVVGPQTHANKKLSIFSLTNPP